MSLLCIVEVIMVNGDRKFVKVNQFLRASASENWDLEFVDRDEATELQIDIAKAILLECNRRQKFGCIHHLLR